MVKSFAFCAAFFLSSLNGANAALPPLADGAPAPTYDDRGDWLAQGESSRVGSTSRFGAGYVFGAGLLLGEPFALSAKLWMGPSLAFAAGLGYSAWHQGVMVNIDATYQFRNLITGAGPFEIMAYAGGGLGVGSGYQRYPTWAITWNGDTVLVDGPNRFVATIRIVGGAAMLMRRYPIELFLEVSPQLEIAPWTGGRIGGGLGVRYYF